MCGVCVLFPMSARTCHKRLRNALTGHRIHDGLDVELLQLGAEDNRWLTRARDRTDET